MPRISAFYGISIYMYYREHAPPHFHAMYGEHEATVSIDTLDGALPRRARSLVEDWAGAHRRDLEEAWDLARASQPLPTIDGLD